MQNNTQNQQENINLIQKFLDYANCANVCDAILYDALENKKIKTIYPKNSSELEDDLIKISELSKNISYQSIIETHFNQENVPNYHKITPHFIDFFSLMEIENSQPNSIFYKKLNQYKFSTQKTKNFTDQYQLLLCHKNLDIGFCALLLEDTKNYNKIITISQKESLQSSKDLILGHLPLKQYLELIFFYDQCMQKYPDIDKSNQLIIIGNSLGGVLAQLLTQSLITPSKTNIKEIYTFNSPGIKHFQVTNLKQIYHLDDNIIFAKDKPQALFNKIQNNLSNQTNDTNLLRAITHYLSKIKTLKNHKIFVRITQHNLLQESNSVKYKIFKINDRIESYIQNLLDNFTQKLSINDTHHIYGSISTNSNLLTKETWQSIGEKIDGQHYNIPMGVFWDSHTLNPMINELQKILSLMQNGKIYHFSEYSKIKNKENKQFFIQTYLENNTITKTYPKDPFLLFSIKSIPKLQKSTQNDLAISNKKQDNFIIALQEYLKQNYQYQIQLSNYYKTYSQILANKIAKQLDLNSSCCLNLSSIMESLYNLQAYYKIIDQADIKKLTLTKVEDQLGYFYCLYYCDPLIVLNKDDKPVLNQEIAIKNLTYHSSFNTIFILNTSLLNQEYLDARKALYHSIMHLQEEKNKKLQEVQEDFNTTTQKNTIKEISKEIHFQEDFNKHTNILILNSSTKTIKIIFLDRINLKNLDDTSLQDTISMSNLIHIHDHYCDIFTKDQSLLDIKNLQETYHLDFDHLKTRVFFYSTLLTGDNENIKFPLYFGESSLEGIFKDNKPIYQLEGKKDSQNLKVFLNNFTLNIYHYSLIKHSLGIKLNISSKEAKKILQEEELKQKDSYQNQSLNSLATFNPILENDKLLCPHGGEVKLKSQEGKNFKSKGVSLILESDLIQAPITGCSNPPIMGGPCMKVAFIPQSALSIKKFNNQKAPLQEYASMILTDKGMPLICTIKPNQFKVFQPKNIGNQENTKNSISSDIKIIKPTLRLFYKDNLYQNDNIPIYQIQCEKRKITSQEPIKSTELQLTQINTSIENLQILYPDSQLKQAQIQINHNLIKFIFIIPTKIPKIYKNLIDSYPHKDDGIGTFKLLDSHSSDLLNHHTTEHLRVFLAPTDLKKVTLEFALGLDTKISNDLYQCNFTIIATGIKKQTSQDITLQNLSKAQELNHFEILTQSEEIIQKLKNYTQHLHQIENIEFYCTNFNAYKQQNDLIAIKDFYFPSNSLAKKIYIHLFDIAKENKNLIKIYNFMPLNEQKILNAIQQNYKIDNTKNYFTLHEDINTQIKLKTILINYLKPIIQQAQQNSTSLDLDSQDTIFNDLLEIVNYFSYHYEETKENIYHLITTQLKTLRDNLIKEFQHKDTAIQKKFIYFIKQSFETLISNLLQILKSNQTYHQYALIFCIKVIPNLLMLQNISPFNIRETLYQLHQIFYNKTNILPLFYILSQNLIPIITILFSKSVKNILYIYSKDTLYFIDFSNFDPFNQEYSIPTQINHAIAAILPLQNKEKIFNAINYYLEIIDQNQIEKTLQDFFLFQSPRLSYLCTSYLNSSNILQYLQQSQQQNSNSPYLNQNYLFLCEYPTKASIKLTQELFQLTKNPVLEKNLSTPNFKDSPLIVFLSPFAFIPQKYYQTLKNIDEMVFDAYKIEYFKMGYHQDIKTLHYLEGFFQNLSLEELLNHNKKQFSSEIALFNNFFKSLGKRESQTTFYSIQEIIFLTLMHASLEKKNINLSNYFYDNEKEQIIIQDEIINTIPRNSYIKVDQNGETKNILFCYSVKIQKILSKTTKDIFCIQKFSQDISNTNHSKLISLDPLYLIHFDRIKETTQEEKDLFISFFLSILQTLITTFPFIQILDSPNKIAINFLNLLLKHEVLLKIFYNSYDYKNLFTDFKKKIKTLLKQNHITQSNFKDFLTQEIQKNLESKTIVQKTEQVQHTNNSIQFVKNFLQTLILESVISIHKYWITIFQQQKKNYQNLQHFSSSLNPPLALKHKNGIYYPLKINQNFLSSSLQNAVFGGKFYSQELGDLESIFYLFSETQSPYKKSYNTATNIKIIRTQQVTLLFKLICIDELRNGNKSLATIQDAIFFKTNIPIRFQDYQLNLDKQEHKKIYGSYLQASSTEINHHANILDSYEIIRQYLEDITNGIFDTNSKTNQVDPKKHVNFLKALDCIGKNNLRGLHVGIDPSSKNEEMRPKIIGRLATTVIRKNDKDDYSY